MNMLILRFAFTALSSFFLMVTSHALANSGSWVCRAGETWARNVVIYDYANCTAYVYRNTCVDGVENIWPSYNFRIPKCK
jgi:hypothetical protein